MSWKIAAPKAPTASRVEVTVERAFGCDLRADYFERSMAEVAEIML